MKFWKIAQRKGLRMTGKTEVVVMAFGFVLSVPGASMIKGELGSYEKEYAHYVFRKNIGRLSPSSILRHWELCSGKFAEGDMKPHEVSCWYDRNSCNWAELGEYGVDYRELPGSWDPLYDTEFPKLTGGLPLRADAWVSGKIEKSIIEEGECAKRIRGYLAFVTAPRFACVFFPLEMFRRVFSKSWDHIHYRRGYRWCLRGELSCNISRKKLREDSKHFDVFGKYVFYLVTYEEELSGCVFEMLYYFGEDGKLAGWCPSKDTMLLWASRDWSKISVEQKFRELACYFPKIQPLAAPFSASEFE